MHRLWSGEWMGRVVWGAEMVMWVMRLLQTASRRDIWLHSRGVGEQGYRFSQVFSRLHFEAGHPSMGCDHAKVPKHLSGTSREEAVLSY